MKISFSSVAPPPIPLRKHAFHTADAKNSNVYINDNRITAIEHKVEGKKMVLYSGTYNVNADDIYISRMSEIIDGPKLSGYKLWYDTTRIKYICPDNCTEKNTSPNIDPGAIAISGCKFDIGKITKPRLLGEVLDCYRLYKNMTEFGIRVIVMYLTKIDILRIGTINENILFQYVCRIKEYDTLIFIDSTSYKSSVTTKLPKNTKLCENTKNLFNHLALISASGSRNYTHFMNVDNNYFAMHTQVSIYCNVSPYEVFYVFNHNNYDNAITNYKITGDFINFATYYELDRVKGGHRYKIANINGYKYIPKYFDNFTNDTSYSIVVPKQSVKIDFSPDDVDVSQHQTDYSQLPLYVAIDDGPEIKDFVRCLIMGKKNYTVIILCDEDKSGHIDGHVDKHGVPQMTIYRNKNSILR